MAAITFFDLILLIVFITLAPFIAWGLFSLINLIDTVLKVRRGNIKVWRLLPNDQVIKFWSKPEGGKIKIKTKNPGGILNTSTITIDLGKGWIWREGGVPFIKLDKDNVQVPWKVNYIGEGVPREVIDEVADTAFASGTLLGFSNLKNIRQILLLVMISLAISAVGILVNYYLISNIHITTQTIAITGYNLTQNGIPVV